MNAMLSLRPSRRRTRITAAFATVALAMLSVGAGAGMASATATPAPVPPASNPDLAAKCGLDVALILDASTSIGTANAVNQVKNAAKAFVDTFADTDTQIGIVSFNTNVLTHPSLPFTNVTSANVASIKSEIDSYASSGYTNWDDALRQTKSTLIDGASNRTSAPDLVVFLTDGAPNTVGNAPSTGGQYADGSINAVNPAVTDANNIKGDTSGWKDGVHMLSFGVGKAFTAGNTTFRQALAKVAGTDAYGTVSGVNLATEGFTVQGAYDPATTDVLFETDVTKIQATLTSVATSLCGSSLTINKQASTPDAPDTYAAASGWGFTSTPSAAASSYDWVLPTTGAAASKTDTTNASGNVQFQWKVKNVTTWNNSKTITVQEATKSGFTMQTPVCTKQGNGSVPVSNFDAGTGVFKVDVANKDIVTCTVKNRATPKIDLSLTKSIQGSAPYALGTNRVFDVTVSNAANLSDATGVVVKDLLPAGLTYVSHAADQGTYNSGTGVWTVGNLASGSSKTLHITVTLSTLGSKTNLAEVTAADQQDTDSTPNNCQNGANLEDDCATVTVSITREYTLGIKKTAVTTGPLTLGDTATFDIVVTNNGPSPAASGFVVTDQLDAGLTGASIVAGSTDPNLNCSINGSNLLTCTYTGELAKNGTAKVRVTGTVGASLNHADAIPNTGCVVKSANDPASKVCDSTTIALYPDLQMLKAAITGSVVTGADATWMFKVRNNGGPAIAGPFTVTDTLPAGLTNVSVSSLGAGWNCPSVSNTSITCTYTGGLVKGGYTTLVQITGKTTVVPDVGSTSTLTNKACVADQYNETGADVGNDCSSADVTVTPKADLQMVKSGSASVQAGGTIAYSLSVKNNGPSKTSVMAFTDTLPAGLTSAGFVADANWTCNVVSTTLTCSWVGGLIDSGSSTTTVTWNATVGASLADASSVANQACVRAENTDRNADNNCDSTTTKITPKVDLGLVKVADKDTVQVNGGNASWKITVTNYGPSKASGFTVTDTLPDGLTNVIVSGTNWTCPSSPIAGPTSSSFITCTYTGAALAVGASAPVISVSGTPVTQEAATLTNSACTSDDIAGDNLPGDAVLTGTPHYDCGSADVNVTPVVDLEMVKDSSPSSVKPGENITYTMSVKNNGPSSTALISFTDTIPAGLTPLPGTLTYDASKWSCDLSANQLDCTWIGGSVAKNASTSNVTIQATVGDSLADNSSVSNTACTDDAFTEPENAPNDCDTTTTKITPVYSLVIQKKQVEANPVAPGSSVHYELTVTNNGPSTAPAGFSVSDPVPGLLDVTDASGAGFDCSATVGNSVSCAATASLAKGASRVVTVTATVKDAAANAEPVTNTACIGNGTVDETSVRVSSLEVQGGPVGTTGACSSVTTQFPSGNLSLGKSNDPVEATPLQGFGSQITYTLTATANGTLNQKNVVVTDILPGYDGGTPASARSTFDSATCYNGAVVIDPCATYDSGTHKVTANLGDITAGSVKTVVITVTIPTQASPSNPAPNSVDIYNQGHATSTYSDDVPSNTVKNVLNVTTAAGEPSNDCVEDTPVFAVNGSGFFAGETVKMDVTGKDGTKLENYAPSNLGAPVTATADSNGNVSFSGVWWPGFSVDSGTDVKTYPGPNWAQIKVVLHGSPASNPVTINYPPAQSGCAAALQIVKSNNPGSDVTITSFGTSITYTIKVTAPEKNVYNSEGVVVTDVVPGSGTLTSGTVTYKNGSAACDATIPDLGALSTCVPAYVSSTKTLTWALGDMRPGDTRQVSFTVTVDQQTTGATSTLAASFDIQNQASVDSDFTDPVTSNVVVNPVKVPVGGGGGENPGTPTDTGVKGTKLVKTGADLVVPAALLGMILVGLGFGFRRLGRDPQ